MLRYVPLVIFCSMAFVLGMNPMGSRQIRVIPQSTVRLTLHGGKAGRRGIRHERQKQRSCRIKMFV